MHDKFFEKLDNLVDLCLTYIYIITRGYRLTVSYCVTYNDTWFVYLWRAYGLNIWS